jgi:HSP20 family protein
MFFTTRDYTDLLKELNDLNWTSPIRRRDRDYIYENGVLEVSLPGYSKDEVSIEIKGLQLNISGSTENDGLLKRSFEKSFSLPEDLDTNNVKASMENGILRIEFQEAKEGSKKIKIS